MPLVVLHTGGDYHDLLAKVADSLHGSVDVYLNYKTESIEALSHTLVGLYSDLRQILLDKGFDYSFPIDVLFYPIDLTAYDEIYVSSQESDLLPPSLSVTVIPSEIGPAGPQPSSSVGPYHTTAVGGTFDHIHDGHKILLSAAVYLASSRLIIGISDDKLLQKKKYKEVLQPFDKRLNIVLKFIQKICGSITIEIFKIVDVCGPTGYLRDIDCLVLSQESALGGKYVNEFRKSIGFPELEVFEIGLVGGEQKLSSTDLRREEYDRTHS